MPWEDAGFEAVGDPLTGNADRTVHYVLAFRSMTMSQGHHIWETANEGCRREKGSATRPMRQSPLSFDLNVRAGGIVF